MRIIHIPIVLVLLLAGLACLCFVYGQEPKARAAESLDSLRARAEKGDPDAQWDLGFRYDAGLGVPQDYAEAVRWYRKAAEQGQTVAQHNLGVMYNDGTGVPQDYAEAVRWFRKAADKGYADSQFGLGLMYYKGDGVTQDYVEAHMWLNLAASRAVYFVDKQYADMREEVARKLTPQQLAEAQRRAREWKPKTAQESKTPTKK